LNRGPSRLGRCRVDEAAFAAARSVATGDERKAAAGLENNDEKFQTIKREKGEPIIRFKNGFRPIPAANGLLFVKCIIPGTLRFSAVWGSPSFSRSARWRACWLKPNAGHLAAGTPRLYVWARENGMGSKSVWCRQRVHKVLRILRWVLSRAWVVEPTWRSEV